MSGSGEQNATTAVLAAALLATASTAGEAVRRRASSFSAASVTPAPRPQKAEPEKATGGPAAAAAAEDVATVDAVRAAIPAHCFEKDTLRSLGFLLQDVTILMLLYAAYPYAKGLLIVPWIFTTGFFMWCLFVVGHDCGHSTFSPYPLLNSIFGNLSHGFLAVPFQPWANSHAVHHRYHNNADRDVSHPWFLEEHYDMEITNRFELVIYAFPFVAYHLYLLGFGDGSHFVPWVGSIGSDEKRRSKAIHRGNLADWISTFSALAIPTAFFFLWAKGSWADFFIGYICPIGVFNAWLTIVTFAQHHTDDTKAWTDGSENWTFARGAFETVDRSYGFPIDELSHNITDSHLVHHIFAREIPHFRLREATEAVEKARVAKGYKYVKEIPYIGFIISYYKAVWDCRVMIGSGKHGEYVPVGSGKGAKAQ